ncbi:dihydropteroate synthase [Peptoniphilus mikwangii]|uniref:dihydropteroate synthase n=1 Tax=Peptoniphilus mikwangii TaxID=1354300 RepID=UPI000409FBB4|nr:dihydropteroate synthase [Peptoniphilus mikwangii]
MERVFRYKNVELSSGNSTKLCAIVNVTPDSFSDGGLWYGKDLAVNRALELIKDGAKMIDIGGESTRPGSTPVSVNDEIERIVPVIKELKKITDIPISVDTWKAEVAKAAIEAGADIINDITGFLGDPEMAKVVGDSKVGAIVMFNPIIARPNHPGSKIFPSFGGEGVFSEKEFLEMETMQIEEVMKLYFEKSLQRARECGIEKERIMLDPGIGFGLTKRENLCLIKNIELIHKMGYFAFLGVSRKRFICNIIQDAGFEIDPETEDGRQNRDLSSANLTAIASFLGTEVVRVHMIKSHLMASEIGDSIRLAEKMEDINFKSYSKK